MVISYTNVNAMIRDETLLSIGYVKLDENIELPGFFKFILMKFEDFLCNVIYLRRNI